MCHCHRLVMSLFLVAWLASMLQVSLSIVYSSSTKVEELVLQEEQILNNLHTAVEKLGNEAMVSSFSQFYHQRLPKARERQHNTTVLRYLRHPNGIYSIIRQFAADYQNIRSTLSVAQSPSVMQLLDSIPTEADVVGVTQSVINLQDVYNLTVSDMVKGNYLGFSGPQLSERDLVDIGETAFNDNQWRYAISWLEEALKVYTPEQPMAGFSTFESATSSKERILSLLGRSYLRLGDKAKAMHLYRKARDSNAPQPDSHLSKLEEELRVNPEIATAPQTDENFNRLCQLQNKITLEKFDPRISCSYKDGVLPYYRFKQELISISPYVTLFYDVITDHEIEALKTASRKKLQRGTLQRYGAHVYDNYRTSHIVFLADSASPDAVGALTLRLAAITNLKTASWVPGRDYCAEPFQIASYGTGGQYRLHYDYNGDELLHDNLRRTARGMYGGDRLATVLIYLTDVERGGSTVFPTLDVAVSPVKKMAVFWYNAKPSGELDILTLHGGCPVVVGNKWVSNKWIWNNGNTFTRRCGLTPDVTQMDIEPYMRKGWV